MENKNNSKKINDQPINSAPDETQRKLAQLPEDVLAWMSSSEASTNTEKIAKRFNLPEKKIPMLAKITGLAILKDISLSYLTKNIEQSLAVNEDMARQIAIEMTVKQFLPIREYLKGVESFITQMGGSLPADLPPKPKVISQTIISQPEIAGPTQILKKPFRQAIQENKEILNQLLTANPIKIADFEEPVRPTIKNWLSDYIKQKGTGYHDELERSDYLYKNANAANLPNEERAKLAKILRAYDEDSEVPVAAETKLILIEELAKKEPPVARQSVAPPPPPPAQFSQVNLERQAPSVPQAATPPAPTFASPPPSRTDSDTYREPVKEEDLEGPLKPPVKPAPRLEGNIVDLKNLDEKG